MTSSVSRIAAGVACLLVAAVTWAQEKDAARPERGVVLTPRNFPQHSSADIEDMFARARQLGTFGIIVVHWSDPEHMAVASAVVRLAQASGLTPIVALRVTDPDAKSRVTPPAAVVRSAARASFADPAVRAAFVATATRLAGLRPPYLALGIETDGLAGSDPAELAAFAAAYHEAYAAAKHASPDTRVFTGFSWDAFAGNGDPKRAEAVLALFRPDLDLLAFHADPTYRYLKLGPSSLPAGYFDGLARLRRPGERLLLEVGWRALGERGPAMQAEFIRRLPQLTRRAAPELLAWDFLHDVSVQGSIVGLGLLERDGTPKPALAAFAELPAAAAPRERAGSGVAEDRLAIAGLGDEASGGIFDPSFANDGGTRIWMSYSAVAPSRELGHRFNAVSTHLAYSEDGGEQWREFGAVNPSAETNPPRGHDAETARWEHEVSRLAYDPWAAEATRWKLLWHRYLRVHDGKSADSTPLYAHGWLELRTAASPEGPWSAGRKLFAGHAYDAEDDSVLGPPELRLDRLAPGAQGLERCAAFTEPGLIAREDGLYVVLRCATGKPDGWIAELRCDHELRSCEYRGVLLRDEQAAAFGRDLSGFSGSDLAERDGAVYLVATPTRQPGETYHGCLFFPIDSLPEARLRARGDRPAVALEVKAEGFHGACGYPGAKVKSGVFLSQFSERDPRHFQIVKTGRHPELAP